MLTDDRELYERAVLQGHYNNRVRQEVSDQNPLKRFATSGLGLKLRAHPLAVAIDLQQSRRLNEYLDVSQQHAALLSEACRSYNFLSVAEPGNRRFSWYAFIIRFRGDAFVAVSREDLVAALKAEGLCETDVPGSTSLLSKQALFSQMASAFPGRTWAPRSQTDRYVTAESYDASVIKFPVWAFAGERHIVGRYVEGSRKVCDALQEHGRLRA